LQDKWHFSDIKPQFKIIAAVLDTVRAVSDDRSTSSTPYNDITHAHRSSPSTFMDRLDPGYLCLFREFFT
jgi:hypothetical protein